MDRENTIYYGAMFILVPAAILITAILYVNYEHENRMPTKSTTVQVVEPVKSDEKLVFPAHTRDWKVIAYGKNSEGSSRILVTIEYWCNFEGDPLEIWTKCYPSASGGSK